MNANLLLASPLLPGPYRERSPLRSNRSDCCCLAGPGPEKQSDLRGEAPERWATAGRRAGGAPAP